jgi:hypothetical protein
MVVDSIEDAVAFQKFSNIDENNTRPKLYSSAIVSAPLISWFGLPTLIECEQPSSTSAEAADANDDEGDDEGSDEFAPLRRSPRSQSEHHVANKLGSKHHHHHRVNKSFFDYNDDATPSIISAYTYRVRTRPTLGMKGQTSDDHRLQLRQNSDGTYSNVGSDMDDIIINDVRLSETGPLLTTTATHRQNLSISLDTVINFEKTLSKWEEGDVPPHVHPSMPAEMLIPEYTKTTPALKLWPLAILVFYNVSGGPFGIEPSIRAAGNLYAILGFIFVPLIWSVPEALITAELGSAFQDPSAGVAWVEHAFGEGMGGLVGILAWVSGAVDNAIYPTLFMGYVTSVMGWDKDTFGGMERFVSVAAITVCLAMLNYTGLEFVGNSSLVICVIAMSPFLIMTILGAPKVVPSRWFQLPESAEKSYDLFDDDFQTGPGPLPLLTVGGILWRPFLNNMFWNLNGFDKAGSFAGETTSASTTYPRGIFIGGVMTVFGYLVPLLVTLGATDYSQAEWVDGRLGTVAVDIGGKWLGAWMIFAAGISNVAMFEAEMSSDAFKIMGMGKYFLIFVNIIYALITLTHEPFMFSGAWISSKKFQSKIEVWHTNGGNTYQYNCYNCIQLC